MNVMLVVIPKPDEKTRTILTKGNSGQLAPHFVGKGDVHLLCGDCSFTLVEGATQAAQFANLVFHCPRCGAYNETRT